MKQNSFRQHQGNNRGYKISTRVILLTTVSLFSLSLSKRSKGARRKGVQGSPRIIEKGKKVPTIPLISDFELDLTNSFEYQNFDSLQEAEYKSNHGALQWEHKLKSNVWNFPTYNGNLNLFTSEDYNNCYFNGFNGTHAYIGNIENTREKISELEMGFDEWKSLKVYMVWVDNQSLGEDMRRISFIDRFGDLRIMSKNSTYRIALKGSGGRVDYDIISKGILGKNGEDDHLVESLFYFKTSDQGGFYSDKMKVVLFSFFWGQLSVEYVDLFTPDRVEEIQEILNVDCFFRGVDDIYCLLNVRTNLGTYPDNFLFYLLKRRKIENGTKNYFEVVNEFNGADKIFRGVINLDKSPNPFLSRNYTKIFAYDRERDTLLRCTVMQEDMNVEDFRTYFNNCTTQKLNLVLEEFVYVRSIDFVDDFFIANFRSKLSARGTLKVAGVMSSVIGSPENSKFEEWNNQKIALVRSKGFYFIELGQDLLSPRSGYSNPALILRIQKPKTEKKITVLDITIEVSHRSYKNVSATKNFNVCFVSCYSPGKIITQSSENIFNIPNTAQYSKFWYKPFMCLGDTLSFTYKTKFKHKISISNYYRTFLPNLKYPQTPPDEGGCGLPPSESLSASGKICIHIKEKKRLIFIEYNMRVVNFLIIQNYLKSPHEGDLHFSPVKMDISHLGMNLKSARAMNDTGLIFIESTEYGKGFLIRAGKSAVNFFKMRVLEDINTEHFLSKNGLFKRVYGSKYIFSYFSVFNGPESIIDYSMVIDMDQCYVSLKSKTLGQSLNVIQVNATINENTIFPINFSVNSFDDKTGFFLKIKKKLKISKIQDLEKFDLNIYEYFDVKGHGPAVDYPISNNYYLNRLLKLEVDESLSVYNYNEATGFFNKYITRTQDGNDSFAIFYIVKGDASKQIQIYKNGDFLRKFDNNHGSVFNLDVVSYRTGDTEDLCFLLKSRSSMMKEGNFTLINASQMDNPQAGVTFNASRMSLIDLKKNKEFQILVKKTTPKIEIFKYNFQKNCSSSLATLFVMSIHEEFIPLELEAGDFVLGFSWTYADTQILEIKKFNATLVRIGEHFEEEFEVYNVDSQSLSDLNDIVLSIKDQFNYFFPKFDRYENKVNLAIDLSDLCLHIITFELEFDSKTKTLKFKNISIEEYHKPIILIHYSLRITKDFLICATVSSPLRKYQEADNQNIGIVMIWARRPSPYRGNGYIYRVEKLRSFDTQNTVIVENYTQNIVSILALNGIQTQRLSNSLRIVKTFDPQTRGLIDLQALDIRVRGNYWSSSDYKIDIQDFIDIQKKPDGGNGINSSLYLYFLVLCFVMVVIGILYTFFSVCFFILNGDVKVDVSKLEGFSLRFGTFVDSREGEDDI